MSRQWFFLQRLQKEREKKSKKKLISVLKGRANKEVQHGTDSR